MSVIKNLKQKPENNINVVSILEKLVSVSKTKYLELYLKLVNKEILTHERLNEFKDRISYKMGYEIDMNEYEILFAIFLYDYFSHKLNIEDYNEFAELNEKKLIIENDLTKIESFSEIKNLIGIARFNKMEKELEKQVHRIFEDDDWLIIRPLSAEASNKYGSGTTWCTSSKNNSYTFYDYSRNGLLIYTINKKSGFKVAIHMNVDQRNLTFWNQNDQQVDSLFIDLPTHILDEIREHIKTQNVSNYDFCDDELKKEFHKHLDQNKISASNEVVERIPQIGRPVRDEDEMPMKSEISNDDMVDEDYGEDDVMCESDAPQEMEQSSQGQGYPLGTTQSPPLRFSESNNTGLDSGIGGN